jgi:hypothetical protein
VAERRKTSIGDRSPVGISVNEKQIAGITGQSLWNSIAQWSAREIAGIACDMWDGAVLVENELDEWK